jgi:hypothetical protein
MDAEVQAVLLISIVELPYSRVTGNSDVMRLGKGCRHPTGSPRRPVYGELLFRQATWHATLLHPFLYVIDSKRAPNFGEAQAEDAIVNEFRFKH